MWTFEQKSYPRETEWVVSGRSWKTEEEAATAACDWVYACLINGAFCSVRLQKLTAN